MSNSLWVVETVHPTEEDFPHTFQVGDTVRCIGTNSRHYGQVGKIVEKGWVLVVEYPNTTLRGHHPARILQKLNIDHFETEFHEEDLFQI